MKLVLNHFYILMLTIFMGSFCPLWAWGRGGNGGNGNGNGEFTYFLTALIVNPASLLVLIFFLIAFSGHRNRRT